MRALVHVTNEDPIMCDLDSMPNPTDIFLRIRNPRKRDGKPFDLLDEDATSFLYPWTRITFVELYEEDATRESIVGFFRESGSA